jgi:periplasmic divalent cation tolerance protein
MSVVVVLTNLPDSDAAFNLGRHLVEHGLAACANVLAPVRSVYRWQGRVEEASEVPLLIKTTGDRYAAVENAIRLQHPYELPEILSLPVDNGLAAYLDWVAAQTNCAAVLKPSP